MEINSFELLARSMVIAVTISSTGYLVLKRFTEKRLNRIDAIRAQSLASIDALRSHKLQIGTPEELKQQLCTDVMNYVMTARTKAAAEEYLRTVEGVIGPDNQDLLDDSHQIVRERFSSKSRKEDLVANC
jgi:hypothetical protein